MITFITPSPPGVVRAQASGTLTREDYATVLPILREAVEEHGTVQLLVEVNDLKAVTPMAAWKELKFDVQHARDIGRFAVVGDAAWLKPLVALAGTVVGEARLFASAERADAHLWIVNGD